MGRLGLAEDGFDTFVQEADVAIHRHTDRDSGRSVGLNERRRFWKRLEGEGRLEADRSFR